MSKEDNLPVTSAIRVLRAAGVAYEIATYDYQEHGGTQRASAELGIDEHATVKTIVMETLDKKPFIVLMHGDREISTKQMARAMNVKSVAPCAPETATRHTGYLVGGTSPFGTRKAIPVYAEATLFDLPQIWINAGHRGMLVRLTPDALERVLHVERVRVAITG